MLGSGSLSDKKWVVAYRYADTPQERPRHRFTLDYNVNPRVQVGFEYNFVVEEFGLRATWVLNRETEREPMIHLNTSSDRIGTPPGYQQVSLTFAKAIPNTPLAPYVSLTYSGFDKKLLLPFGINVQLAANWSLLGLNDGRKSHILLTYSRENYYLQAGYIWLKRPSFTIGWGF